MTFSATVNVAGRKEGSHHQVSGPSGGEAARRASLDFNPSGNQRIASVKGFSAAAIQAVINERDKLERPGDDAPQAERDAFTDALRCFEIALKELESAKMWAVKGVCSKTVAGALPLERNPDGRLGVQA